MEILKSASEVLPLILMLAGPMPLSLLCAKATGHGDPFEKVAGRLLAFLVCWCFIETFLGLLLGVTGKFTSGYAAAAQAGLFVSGAWALKFRNETGDDREIRSPASGLSKTSLVVLSLFSILSMLLLWSEVVWPTVDSDSMGYHLPLMAKLVHNGRISFLDRFPFQEHFPRNWETLCALPSLAVKNDMVSLCPNMVAWGIFGLSMAGLSLRAGVSRNRSLAAAFLMLTAPILLEHMQSMHVDLPFAAFFLAALYFTQVSATVKPLAHFTCIAMAAAMFLGIKSTGLLYSALLSLAMLGSHAGRIKLARIGKIPKHKIALFAGSMAVLLLPGAFWYAYNLIHFGSPMFGVEISIGRHVLFPGMYTPAGLSESSVLHVFKPTRIGDLNFLSSQILSQLSFVFLALLACSGIFIIASMLKFRETMRDRGLLTLIFLTGAAFLIYCKTPFSGNYDAGLNGITDYIGQAFRLGFVFIGLLAVLGALGMERLKVKDPALLFLAIAAFAYAVGGNRKILAASALMVAAILSVHAGYFSGAVSFLSRNRKPAAGLAGAAVGLLLFSAYLPAENIRSRNRLKRSYGPAMDFIDRNVRENERIAFLNSDQGYALFGSTFSHDVIYAPYRDSDSAGWMHALKARHASVIGFGPSTESEANEGIKRFLDHSSDEFKPIYGGDPGREMVLYRLVGPAE